jgi:glycosyltransferase involved in cell wall biosynthesis
VVEAFILAKPAGMKLVIAGGSMGSDEYAMKLKTSAPRDVIFAGARSSEDVRTLYRNAALFVHPSHLEGFAMVVLEAVAADTPILVSDIPAHLEVELDAASYYACGDVRHLAAILAAGNYERLRCSHRAEILEENDWNTVARRHRDIFFRRVHARPAAETGTPGP